MMADIHIADGIAVKLLLAGLVIASGAVGALGLAPVTSQTVSGGVAGDSFTAAFPIDNATMAFPIDNATMAFPIDNATMAFPIDNVTSAFSTDDVSVSAPARDVTGTSHLRSSGVGSTGVNVLAFAREAPDELPQDMDPY